jgi:hypothetical protein
VRTTPLLLLLLAACSTAGTSGDDTDTDGGGETDTVDTHTGGDTDTDGGGDTDVVTVCAPGRLDAGTQLPGEPDAGADVHYTRTIDLCADDSSLEGSWVVTVEDDAGDRWCGFEVLISSSTPADGCDGCELGFEAVDFHDASFSDTDLCAIFGLDADFVAGLDAFYPQLGVDADEADLLFWDDEDGDWAVLDQTPETLAAVEDVDGVTHLTLTYDTTYAY